jgi:MEMO1 family protein
MCAPHVSPFSGSWYPEDPRELASLLDELFVNSEARCPYVTPGAVGYVVPHAGPAYSGTVAAAVYRAIARQQPERIFVLGFPHRGGLHGVAAPDAGVIRTPLGEVAIDHEPGVFPLADEDRVCDHSFEIQLPFLQRVAPSARITPLYVGPMNARERAEAAEKLAAVWRPGAVFLASSDFTHYGRNFGFTPFPPDSEAKEKLRELDFECMEAAATLRPERFLETLKTNGATVCGSDPIALLLDAASRVGELYQERLDYQTSGEITDDFRHSVSYAALGYYPRSAFELEPAAREALLESSATALAHLRATGEQRPVAANGPDSLRAVRGAFVSLHRGDELLGCLGNIEGRCGLAEDIPKLAISAALHDTRFSPAARALGPLDIEISVLTPFRRIFREEECEAGRHGVYLELGGRAGLLLPQVAADREWNTEQFLQALALKSRTAQRAWRDPDARLFVFEAQVFSRQRAVE